MSSRDKSRKCFCGVERGWRIRQTILPPPVSQVSKQCGILNISQPYRPPWTDRDSFIFFTNDLFLWCPLCGLLGRVPGYIHYQRSRVAFPAVPDFISSGTGMGSTQSREDNSGDS
jgi:hypothetical protein